VALCADEKKMTTPTTTRKICAFFFTGLDKSRLTNLDWSRFENECTGWPLSRPHEIPWHPIPFPQLLQPQLLNSWLSGLTLFFINMKHRLLTISVKTRYRVSLLGSTGKVRENSLTFLWLFPFSLTLPWPLWNSLTFPGFPAEWSPWCNQ